MQKLVSIIVPCYNQAIYLTECLNSVLNQTYSNWECLIIDDGSPDNTFEIANLFIEKDKRFKYFKKENGGLSSARNFGIKQSFGEFILPLDADDKIHQDYISEVVKIFVKDETITVAIDLSIVDNNKRSALMYACIYGRENAALLLIESGAQLNTIDNDGKTVLDYAISLESSTLIKALKAKGGKTAVQVSVPQGGRRRKTRRARKTTKRNKTPKRR